MSASNWPIDIFTANDDIAAGLCIWRQRKQVFVTVAVKATFTLVPGAAMTLRAPLPIEPAERPISRGVGIEPGDLAPCLVKPEIWVRGHAWHPPAEGAPSVRVRLAVARGPDLLLRKNVEIPIRQDPFVAPYLHALAPLSRHWPVRTRLLGVFDWTHLAGNPMDLPDSFDWTYFQAAPADQQLGPLRGDEWIRLEGMHSTIQKFDTQLPSATCLIKMFGRHDSFRQGVVVRSGLDTVQIDVDQGLCSLLFRGYAPLLSDISFEGLQFVAGIGLPDRPMPELHPRWGDEPEAQLPPVIEDPAILVTSFVDASIVSAMLAPMAGLPFRAGDSALAMPSEAPGPREEHSTAGQTFLFDAGLLDTLAPGKSLPFHESSSESREPIAQDRAMTKPAEIEPIGYIEPIKPAPITQSDGLPLSMEKNSVRGVELDAGSTFFLSEEMLAALEGKEATPFVGGEPAPEREEEVDVLAGLPFARIGEEKTDLESTLGSIFLALIAEVEHVDQPHAGAR